MLIYLLSFLLHILWQRQIMKHQMESIAARQTEIILDYLSGPKSYYMNPSKQSTFPNCGQRKRDLRTRKMFREMAHSDFEDGGPQTRNIGVF